MTALIDFLTKCGLLENDLDYKLIRASMIFIFAYFGYQKWFEETAHVLVPYISHGPLIFWMYPAFGVRGATWFLGSSEWLFGSLLFIGFWNKKFGVVGALGSIFTFVGTLTIIPFMPNAWSASGGAVPPVPFLVKDIVLLAASFYLLKQDVLRLSTSQVRSSHGAGGKVSMP